MYEQALFKNRREGRPATLEEYRAGGGYQALTDTVKKLSPQDLIGLVQESGLSGRGGAGFPTWRKWSFVHDKRPAPPVRGRQHR